MACADIIRGNRELQEGFAQLQVPSPLDETSNGYSEKQNGVANVYVIDGLLDLTLSVTNPNAFNARIAACECLKAYFYNHSDIRLHFLNRAIEGHTSMADETANVLTTLLRPSEGTLSMDPYRHWFAAVITLHLLFEDPKAKALAMAVTEGDESTGEEVVSSIQTITSHLVGGIARAEDSRVLVAYLMLLIGWLFEDLDAVNDFLGEFSNIQGLTQAVAQAAVGSPLVRGLCAALLGVVYEFSTKDSVIPRAKLHPILMSRMGRDRFIDSMNRLRTDPLLRDFEVLPQKRDLSGEERFPEVYFDALFVDFFKDNYRRLMKARTIETRARRSQSLPEACRREFREKWSIR